MAYSPPPPPPGQIYLSTTPEIPGMKIVRSLGVVFGQTVRTRGALGRFIAGIEALVGGKSKHTSQKSRRRGTKPLRT
ncbi:MAG: heavy metal-binding domain-containing protein [Thermoproteota archaeon]